MEKVVPLISSGAAGPLGAIHLPRLWQKLLLSANGQLAEGYDECGTGFDQMLLSALKLDRAATIAYVKKNRPTYPQFEDWVRQQRGGTVPASDVEASNAAIRAYEHGENDCKEILESAGMPHTGALRDAVTLNNLEDWTAFHQSVARA